MRRLKSRMIKCCGEYLKFISDQDAALGQRFTWLRTLLNIPAEGVNSRACSSASFLVSNLPCYGKDFSLSLFVFPGGSSASRPDALVWTAEDGSVAPVGDRSATDSDSNQHTFEQSGAKADSVSAAAKMTTEPFK